MIEYFCVGSTWCLRKEVTGCEICFRRVCNRHIHTPYEGNDFQICSKCIENRKHWGDVSLINCENHSKITAKSMMVFHSNDSAHYYCASCTDLILKVDSPLRLVYLDKNVDNQ